MTRAVWAALTAVVSVALLVGFVGDCQAVEYRMHVLDDLPGMGLGCALDITDSGRIVGSSSYDTGMHLCYWDSSGVHDLHYGLGSNITPVSINNAGTITSVMDVWSNNTWVQLPGLIAPPYGMGEYFGINESGCIVGDANINTAWVYHACLWDSTGPHDLGTLAGQTSSTACGINDHGQIVGVSGTKAFIWDKNVMSPIDIPAGYAKSSAWRINNLGQVIGSCTKYTQWGPQNTAFIWQDHTWTKIGVGAWDTFAKGINDAGQVVGYYTDVVGGTNNAFVWQDGQWTTLPGLGNGTCAYGINEDGWIVGQAYTSDGRHYKAVVWEPVPEPSAIIVLMGGIGGLAAIRRRR